MLQTGYHVQEAFQLMMAEVERISPELLIQKPKGKTTPTSEPRKKDCTIV